MQKESENSRFLDGVIYTLAQSATTSSDNNTSPYEKIVYGEGTDGQNQTALKGRAKCKMITQKTTLQLIAVVEEKGELHRRQAYWNAYHCQGNLTSSKGRIYGKYCKTRFCTLCLRIRKAEIINKYLPVIEQWKDPFFVTLTIKAVPEEKLKTWIKGMGKIFRWIKNKYRKRHQRGKSIKLMGIKSLECNFNPIDKTYNPHFHFIVPNKETADILMIEWQRYMNKTGKKYTSPFGQHRRRIKHNKVEDLIEIIKYGSKIFTEPDIKKKSHSKSKIPPKIYAAALDNIFCAMKGIRLFDRFGFDLPKEAKRKKETTNFIRQFEEWEYDARANDWVNPDTGELMTGYVPPAQLQYLLNHNIDTDLE